MENSCEIVAHIATISENRHGGTLELNKIRWHGKPETWDLRRWGLNENGERAAFKGVSMTDAEWAVLKDIVTG